MPACVYLDDYEVASWAELLPIPLVELLLDINRRASQRWAIRPRTIRYRQWFQQKEVTLYSLFCHLDSIEWQCINFPGGESSLNFLVEEPLVHTFLLGLLAGFHN